MMKYPFLYQPGVLLAIFLIMATGCASTAPTRFYSLSSLVASDSTKETTPVEQDIAIGVGPVEIPDYLDRPHIITRTGQNEIKIADFDKWAGSLKTEISRVIAEDLSILLSTGRAYVYPWKKYVPVNYQIVVNVSRFEGSLGGDVVLKAHWIIMGGESKKVILMDTSSFSEKTDGNDYGSLVAAKSRMFTNLSREIATALTRLIIADEGSATYNEEPL